MKKIFVLLCTVFFVTGGQAQDATLKDYVGKYTFPEGSAISSADVTLKDTVLTINSVQGSSDLLKRSRDTFALLSYEGYVYFKRESGGKVSGIKVEVGNVLMEGAKEAGSTGLRRRTAAGSEPAATR